MAYHSPRAGACASSPPSMIPHQPPRRSRNSSTRTVDSFGTGVPKPISHACRVEGREARPSPSPPLDPPRTPTRPLSGQRPLLAKRLYHPLPRPQSNSPFFHFPVPRKLLPLSITIDAMLDLCYTLSPCDERAPSGDFDRTALLRSRAGPHRGAIRRLSTNCRTLKTA